ncbi:MAG: anaerobic C4-dicarboxylate transporter [Rhodospirillales bacterium]
MGFEIIAQFVVLLAAIYLGSRTGGVGLGLWGGVGVFVLTYVFGLQPTSPPIDVMLIILAVVMASAVMEAAGGIEYLVGVAGRIIRRNPQHITVVAPLVCYVFTFGAGTGHIFYPLLPIIFQVAYENGIRPERPMAVSTIASQQAITASPVSAATAAMISLFEPLNYSLPNILVIAIPATIAGVLVAALVQTRVGVPLDQDPEYQRRLKAGEIEAAVKTAAVEAVLPPSARWSAFIFLGGVALVVLSGLFPDLRPPFHHSDADAMSMALTIEIVMLSVAAVMMLLMRVKPDAVVKTQTARAGLTAVIGIFGLAWLGDTFIAGNSDVIIGGIGELTREHPFIFALGLFFASVLLFSQAATTRALMPLGISLGLSPAILTAFWPAVNGYFFLPTYGSLIAAINFDRSGTTRIGRYILNHSFMLPGLVATITAIAVGSIIAQFMR